MKSVKLIFLYLFFFILLLSAVMAGKRLSLEEQRSNIAIESNDPILCNKSGPYAGNCYYQLALKLSNPSLCQYADKFKYICYKELAFKTRDFSLCVFTNENKCLLELSDETGIHDICRYSSTKQEECFQNLYRVVQNKSICPYLIEKPESCLCVETEYLIEGKCEQLKCKDDEFAANNTCNKYCGEAYFYKNNRCYDKCGFGYYNIEDGSCERSAIVFVLYYLFIDLSFFFVMFLVFISAIQHPSFNKALNTFKKNSILWGVKFLFVFVNVVLVVVLLFGDIEEFSDRILNSTPWVSSNSIGLFLLVVPFVTGFFYWFVSRKKTFFRRISSGIILSFGITFFINRIYFVDSVFNVLVYPVILLENFLFGKMPLILHIVPEINEDIATFIYYFLPSVVGWTFEFLLILIFVFLSRYLYNLFFENIINKTKFFLPLFVRGLFLYTFLLLPLVFFFFPETVIFQESISLFSRFGLDASLAWFLFNFLVVGIFFCAKYAVTLHLAVKKLLEHSWFKWFFTGLIVGFFRIPILLIINLLFGNPNIFGSSVVILTTPFFLLNMIIESIGDPFNFVLNDTMFGIFTLFDLWSNLIFFGLVFFIIGVFLYLIQK